MMKVYVIGTRGIPDIEGGIEMHCQQLYPRLVGLGCDVTVARRSTYVTASNQVDTYRGVRIDTIWSVGRCAVGTALHTLCALVKAKLSHPDLVHIHAVGPCYVLPLARLLGLRVVATHHGADYNREKWGTIARAIIRLGENFQARYARHIIAISPEIVDLLAARGRTQSVTMIPNGVAHPGYNISTDQLEGLGVEPQQYVLAVGRFVPEKRLDQLIRCFERLNHPGLKLVIAGSTDDTNTYSRTLIKQAHEAGVILTGYVNGDTLSQLYAHARLFVLASSHEGLPITLLEAMSHGTDVLVSDIAANRLSQLDEGDFFNVGDDQSLLQAMRDKLAMPSQRRHYDMSDYDWDNIAKRTLDVYRQVLDK